MRTNLAQEAVDKGEVYGRWRIEARVPGSTRKVIARCLDCTKVYEVDLYALRRKDRGNVRCQSCNNKLISANNRLPPGLALVKNMLQEYRKSARIRGHRWSLTDEQFESLIFKPCHYCGASPSRRVESSWDYILVNGIDRKDNAKGYCSGNSVSCCADCNYAKRNLSEQDFIKLCERVTSYVGSRNRSQV